MDWLERELARPSLSFHPSGQFLNISRRTAVVRIYEELDHLAQQIDISATAASCLITFANVFAIASASLSLRTASLSEAILQRTTCSFVMPGNLALKNSLKILASCGPASAPGASANIVCENHPAIRKTQTAQYAH
jgi:hypothetical protein